LKRRKVVAIQAVRGGREFWVCLEMSPGIPRYLYRTLKPPSNGQERHGPQPSAFIYGCPGKVAGPTGDKELLCQRDVARSVSTALIDFVPHVCLVDPLGGYKYMILSQLIAPVRSLSAGGRTATRSKPFQMESVNKFSKGPSKNEVHDLKLYIYSGIPIISSRVFSSITDGTGLILREPRVRQAHNFMSSLLGIEAAGVTFTTRSLTMNWDGGGQVGRSSIEKKIHLQYPIGSSFPICLQG
jgi:hypothetical protein